MKKQIKSNENSVGNRKYKDSLFCFLFGNEEYKNFTLDLYNAVNGTSYTNADDITITTLQNIVFINIKNDVSFLFSGTMNFYEHQSTFNPNMPVRILLYAGKIYSKYINDHSLDIYSSSKLSLPVPKCICFYNGADCSYDKKVLKLSDSFPQNSKPDIDISVTMLNINYGNNKKLLKSCKPLEEYAIFVDEVRKNIKSNDEPVSAINKAIDHFPDDSLLKPLLMSHRSEVMEMCVLEYTQEYADKVRKIEMDRLKKNVEDAKKKAAEDIKAAQAKAAEDIKAAQAKAAEAENRAAEAEKKFNTRKNTLIQSMREQGLSEEKIQLIIDSVLN